ncbi:MAG: peptidylprolyl isomerase [Verrucomicrobia bacterium]|nr:peptidylprolyl isomerase [Verrucomicrobiota bacterium]MDA1065965.1 peptidylprolyl isomerase [Verrucomicrobiota bacterium]
MSDSTNPKVSVETSKGTITLELYQDKAPISVKNFLSYVEKNFFAETIFHRVIPNFMIQCGGFTENMRQKNPDSPIKNEADNGVSNDRYTIAMARTQVVDSATSQFFINTSDNDFLNHGGRDFGYAVFGKVVDGTDVVDAIGAVATGNKAGHGDVPLETVLIKSASLVS